MGEYKPANKDGNLSKYRTLIVLIALVIAYFLVHFAMPYTEAYYAKSIMRKACHEKIRETISGWDDDSERSKWKGHMISRLNAHQIRITEDTFVIEVEQVARKSYKCNAQILFRLTSNWGIIADFFEMDTFVTKHQMSVEVKYTR
ncbi:MAG: hypothetical protein GY822_06245 [Deltaproteobacteria bacterium]|nr:hypothetical protein [Deltaproteobacteria bacterium]